MKYYFVILLSLLVTLPAWESPAQTGSASGLLFQSKTESISGRTSLDLFSGEYRKYKDNFSVEFDISIVDVMRFGYVMRLVDENNEELSLVFVNFGDNVNFDTRQAYHFNVHSTVTNKFTRINIDKSKLGEGLWIHISFSVDLAAGSAVVELFGDRYLFDDIGFANPDRLKLIFGLYGINLDVPAMALRNISIKENGRQTWFFPLNESEGEAVHDRRGREIGSVKNPVWLINRHHQWAATLDIITERTAGIAYDARTQQLNILGRDSVIRLDMPSRETQSLRLPVRLPFSISSGRAIHKPGTPEVYIYNLHDSDDNIPSVAILDVDSLVIRHIADPEVDNKLHHHNVFFHNGSMMIFGGYGNFSYSDRLYRLDVGNEKWVETPTLGDAIYPRFFSASGTGRNPSELLIFGGFGNQSGRQEFGGKNLYDLISLDLASLEARKLWEIGDIDSLFVPCSNLILSEDKKHFYTLCYPHHVAHSQLNLYCFSIADGSYELVSDAIPILSEEICTEAYLFHNDEMNEFITVVREYVDSGTSNVRVYLLSSPPVSAAELVTYPGKKYNALLPGMIAAIVVGAGISLVCLRRRKKGFGPEPDITDGHAGESVRRVKSNAVYILDDFLAFDSSGKDITHRFSLKLRSLFLIVLFNSKPEDDGISTEKLSSDLWPDRELHETKNVRGVTINHLRKVIADMDGIELVNNNSRWTFVMTDAFYCDYLRTLELAGELAAREDDGEKEANELISTIMRGSLIPWMQEMWCESYRDAYDRVIENSLKLYIRKIYRFGQYERIVRLTDALFVLDPLNEDVLTIGILTLRKMERLEQAHKMYNRFCSRYKMMLGENYGKKFTSIN